MCNRIWNFNLVAYLQLNRTKLPVFHLLPELNIVQSISSLLHSVLLLSIPKQDLLIILFLCGTGNIIKLNWSWNKIILFPVWMILFSVLRIDAGNLGGNKKHFVMKLFCQRPWSARNNSISCLVDSISCSEHSIWTLQGRYPTFCKIRFSIPALKIG